MITALKDHRIVLLKGDITRQAVEAIVNAAKEQLTGGGGVDGVIHRAGGRQIFDECMEIPPRYGNVRCPTGEAVITSGGNMAIPYVIHTVGPIWGGGLQNEKQLLHNAYANSLALAEEKKLKSLAFPNISTGIYGFPKELAAPIAIDATLNFLKNTQYVEKVIFCCFDDENYDIYHELLV